MHETLLNCSILEANKPISYCIWVVLSSDPSRLFADFFLWWHRGCGSSTFQRQLSNRQVTQCPGNCLPKNKAKKHEHCQKTCEGFWQLFGKGRLFGRPFFKTNPQELSTLCIYPKQLLNNTEKASINKTLSITNVAHDFLSYNFWGTSHDPDRVLFWKPLKKCINSYTLDLGWDFFL